MKITAEGLDAARAALGPDVVEKATRSAVNKVAAKAMTAAKKDIRQEYNVKAGDLVRRNKATGELGRGPNNRQGLSLIRARKGGQTALILGRGGPLPLIHFGASPKTPQADQARKRRKGVTVRVKKSTGRTRLQHVFVAQMKSGHIGLFEREEGADRTPIHQLYGPSVPAMLKENILAVEWTVENEAGRIFENELDHFFKKAAGLR